MRQLAGVARSAMRVTILALRGLWTVLRPMLRAILLGIVALLIVLEEWGWRPLSQLLGRLALWRPWARLETAIARLPPYGALVVFTVPTLLLLPLKFLAVLLIAKGQFILAGLLFAAAKVGATALVARLFMLTQPALMQIGWFAWGYDTLMPWKDALVERVRASWVWRVSRVWKERAKRALSAAWRSVRPALARLGTDLARSASRAGVRLRSWVQNKAAR